MDRLEERVEQELDAIAPSQLVDEITLSLRLAREFSSECGQADVRAAVAMAMRRRDRYRPKIGLLDRG